MTSATKLQPLPPLNEDLERVRRALLLSDTHPDQRRIAEIGIEFVATLLRKNSDYGSSAWSTPLLAPEMDVGAAIRVRMSDKIRRIEKLLGNGTGSEPGAATGLGSSPQVADESIEDTMRDLGAYALLWLARPTGPGPAAAMKDVTAATKDNVSFLQEVAVAKSGEKPRWKRPPSLQNPVFLGQLGELDLWFGIVENALDSRWNGPALAKAAEKGHGWNPLDWCEKQTDDDWPHVVERARKLGLIEAEPPAATPPGLQNPGRSDATSRERQTNLERVGHCHLCSRGPESCLCEFGDFTGAEFDSDHK